MKSLFELITNEHLKHYIEVWERSLYPKKFNFKTPTRLAQLKKHLMTCDQNEVIFSELMKPAHKETGYSETLIHEVFSYLDKRSLH